MSNVHGNPTADHRNTTGLAGGDGQEPVEQMSAQRVAGNQNGNDQIEAPEQVDEHLREQRLVALQGALPFWLSDKFFWKASASGTPYLSPKDEYLAALKSDTQAFLDYGEGLLGDKSTEHDLSEQLTVEAANILTTVTALNDQERSRFGAYLKDRAIRNLIYAADTQYEIDHWVARAARAGRDAAQHDNFGEKCSRRDTFSIMGAVFSRVVIGLGQQDLVITPTDINKAINQHVYQQANMRGREFLNPQEKQERENTGDVEMAVKASRPI